MLDAIDFVSSESHLTAIAKALGAADVRGLSAAERVLLQNSAKCRYSLRTVEEDIQAGLDPLGEALCRLRSPEQRRPVGAVYTPAAIIEGMMDWAASKAQVKRVIDPGAGSGRFLLAAARRFPDAQLLGVEIDPLAALLARANAAAANLQDRIQIVLEDYRSYVVPKIAGPTLYIGNPPYVRHHLIQPEWKAWLSREAKKLGVRASQLAGLHAHFFLATALNASPGDFGAFITAAEWLEVNYGILIRDLFLGRLGGQRIIVMEPKSAPFPDTATTAAVTYFQVGSRTETVGLKRVEKVAELADQTGYRLLRPERLASESRWTHLTRISRKVPNGYIELGELCRVHRGQVTGANRVWIAGPHSEGLPPSVLFPTVTRAMELFRAGEVLADGSLLRKVIDLPTDLSVFDPDERRLIVRFLTYARKAEAHLGYIASTRKVWWSVGLRAPAPILATYMARRPPAFVLNSASARHINIAHGLYPREPLSNAELKRLVQFLSTSTSLTDGRTYAGGLTKFEPREMERLLVPDVRAAEGAAE